MNLLTLPTVMLEHIFSFLPYDLISKNRVVCKDFDIVAKRMLNRGFQRIERRISSNLKAIKAQLPRRESERRFHPLSRHCDILTSVETRISMLNMAYNRFIEQGECCFIPGKVLDEMLNVMATVDRADPLPMAFEVLQELRDISGMAMEHFEEIIAPLLRQKVYDNAYNTYKVPSITTQSNKNSNLTVWKEAISRNNRAIIKLDKRCRLLTRKVYVYKRLMTYNKRVLAQKQIEQGVKIAELRKKVDEYEIKFKELSLASGFKNINKETDIHDIIISNMSPTKDKTLHRLKNFGSQIKLDPSTSSIGANKVRKGSPIIKPRRASVTLPSYKAADETNVDSVLLSDCSDKDTDNKSYEDSLNSIRDQLNKVLQEPSNDKTSELINKRSNVVKSSCKNVIRDSSPKPGTSKDSNDDNENRGRKRLFSEEYDQSEGYSGSSFQTKVQVLSKTIMKLIESISDNRDAKRKCGVQRDQEE